MIRYTWIRWTGISLLIVTLACWLLTWKLDSWLQKGIESYVENKTHFKLHIGRLETDLKHASIDIYSVKLSNSPEFSDPRFLDIKEIKVHLDWASLLSSRPLVHELVLDIDEFCGVRNQDGKINVTVFADAFEGKSEKAASPQSGEAKPEQEFLIQRFLFRLDHVTIADYKDGKDDVKTARLNLSRVFNNVTNYQQLISPVVADLSVFVTSYILDSIMQATLDPQQYHKLLPKLLGPMKSTLDKGKQDAQKFLNKFLPDKEAPAASSPGNSP